MTETIRFVGTVTVKPDSAVGSHNDHGIYQEGNQQFPGKKVKQEKVQEGQEKNHHRYTGKRDPVSPRLENIHPAKCFFP